MRNKFWGSLFLVFGLAISMSHAGDYIIADVCLEEAQNINVFRNTVDNQYEKAYLTRNYAGGRLFNYPTLRTNLNNALQSIQSSITNPSSHLSHHLRMCMINEQNCHHYFTAKQDLHKTWFCATHIYKNILKEQFTHFNTLIERCGEGSTLFHSAHFPAAKHPAYQRDCFDQQQNSKLNYYQEQKKIVSDETERFYNTIQDKLARSYTPDAMAYVIGKLNETLADKNHNDVYVTHEEYNVLRFAKSLKQCFTVTESIHDFNRRSQTAAQNYNTFSSSVIDQFAHLPDALTYWPMTPQEYQWMTNNFTLQEKLNPEVTLFLHQQQNHIGYDKCNALPEEEKMSCLMRVASQAQMSESDQTTNRIQEQRLQITSRKQAEQKMEKYRNSAYPMIFYGFLPYQFYRASNAKILLEIQKLSKDQGQMYLRSQEHFINFSEMIICGKNAFHYCSERYKNKRIESRKKLWKNIKDGVYGLSFQEQSANTMISQKRVDQFNAKIKNINDFCYNSTVEIQKNSSSNTYKETHAFTNLSSEKKRPYIYDLNEKLSDLFSTPGLGSFFAYSSMIDLMQFDSDRQYKNCFDHGYLIGGGLTITDAYQRMQANATHGGDTRGINQMTFSDRYQRKYFYVSRDELINVEQSIHNDILKEINLIERSRGITNTQEQIEFLKNSSRNRVFALLDYGLDHPSEILGDAYCELISLINCEEKRKEDILKMVMIVPHIMAAFMVPIAGNVVVQAGIVGVTMTISTVAVIIRHNDIQYVQRKEIDQSLATNNIFPEQAAKLQSYFSKEVSNLKLLMAMDFALMVVADGILIKEGITTLRALKNSTGYRNYHARQMRIDHAIRNNHIDNTKFLNDHRFLREFFARSDLVNDEVFEKFINALHKGEGKDFVRANFSDRFPEIKPTWISQVFKTLGNGLNHVWKNMWDMPGLKYVSLNYYKLMYQHTSQWWVTTKRMSEILNEAVKRNRINHAQLDELLQDMPNLMLKDGKVVLRINEEVKELATKFLQHHVDDSNGLRTFLEPFVYSDIQTPEQWRRAIENFQKTGRKISSKEAAKEFISVIKFSRREINSLAEEFRQPGQLRARYYQKRTEFIHEYLDEFLDLARIERLQQKQDFVKYLKQEGIVDQDDIRELNRFMNEIDYYDLHYVWNNQAKIAQEQADLIHKLKTKPTFSFQNEHVQYYIKEQQGHSEYFFKSLDEALGRQSNADIKRIRKKRYGEAQHHSFTDAYAEALGKTRVRKTIHGECSLPNSPVKSIANKMMANQAKQISLASNAWGYTTVKYSDYDTDQFLDMEWITRLAYDLAIPQLGTHLSMKALTATQKRGLATMGMEWLSGFQVSAVEFGGYWFLSETLWKSTEDIEAVFAKEVRESDNLPKTMEELFSEYPKLYQEVMLNFNKISDFFSIEGIENQNDEYMYERAVKEGLIEQVLAKDADYEKELIDALSDFMYNEAYDNRPKANFPILGDKARLFGVGIQSKEWLLANQDLPSAVHQSIDRILFYRLYDLVPNAQIKYIRSQLVYTMLCKYRYSPKVSFPTAVAIYAAIKASSDPIKYHLREQNTGY